MGRSTRAGDHGQVGPVGPSGPVAPAGPAGPGGFPRLEGPSLAQPLLTLFGVGAVAVGLSGLVAEVMGRVWGAGYVSGDRPGTTYSADRCAEFVEYFPGRGCLEAAALHHWGEVVQYRVVFGVMGLVALLVARRMPHGSSGLPGWAVPGVAALAFLAGALVLGVASLLAEQAGGRGVGAWLSGAAVAAVAAIWSAALAWHRAAPVPGR